MTHRKHSHAFGTITLTVRGLAGINAFPTHNRRKPLIWKALSVSDA